MAGYLDGPADIKAFHAISRRFRTVFEAVYLPVCARAVSLAQIDTVDETDRKKLWATDALAPKLL